MFAGLAECAAWGVCAHRDRRGTRSRKQLAAAPAAGPWEDHDPILCRAAAWYTERRERIGQVGTRRSPLRACRCTRLCMSLPWAARSERLSPSLPLEGQRDSGGHRRRQRERRVESEGETEEALRAPGGSGSLAASFGVGLHHDDRRHLRRAAALRPEPPPPKKRAFKSTPIRRSARAGSESESGWRCQRRAAWQAA